MNFYKLYFKRPLDLTMSFSIMVIFLPLFVLIAVLIKIDSRGGVFFRQERVGAGGHLFRIVKFRSMKRFEDSFNPDGSEISNSLRVTRVGRFLRKYSLDELPQLINIFIGDMSIIGPRPALPYQVDRYNSMQKMRLNVRPGLTGLAQVNGRNRLSWEQKIIFDLKYINNLTLKTDVAIMLKTFPTILDSQSIAFVEHDKISAHVDGVLVDIGLEASGKKDQGK